MNGASVTAIVGTSAELSVVSPDVVKWARLPKVDCDFINSGKDLAEALHEKIAHWIIKMFPQKTFCVKMVIRSNRPVTLKAHCKVRLFEMIQFEGAGVY